MIFAIHGVHSPCSHRSVVRWGGHMQCPCVCLLFVSGRSGIILNKSTGAITDRSQSAKDIDPYFKSQLYVEDPSHWKPVLILPDGLSKPRQQAHDGNLISAMGGIHIHNILIDSPASYHWAITTLWWVQITVTGTDGRSQWSVRSIDSGSQWTVRGIDGGLQWTVRDINDGQNELTVSHLLHHL